MSAKPPLVCAIYTRKSSEEGLEQGFNSLDAQREACEAFVLSQRQEGWRVLDTLYDDGGFSGGNMARPALQRLLEDIERKRIRVVVVYKVDRLTRSLADFAKIVERFDAMGVSFVSVTQQFNTTSSMGRLTLNVLLSFAQFEREVTGERIRDKIAASKQRGMWMGGTPPVGYRGQDRTLVVDEAGAAIVRHLYQRYLATGSVRELKQELDRENRVSPCRVSNAGRTYGGGAFTRGQLYRILMNPVYIGKIPHREQVHPGQHPAIIDLEMWDAVEARLAANRQGHRQRGTTPSSSLLVGLIVDEQGHRLIPSHSQKQSKRYRYYISETLNGARREQAADGIRIPAQEIETLVIDALLDWLADPNRILAACSSPNPEAIQGILARGRQVAEGLRENTQERHHLFHRLVHQVQVRSESVEIAFHVEALLSGSGPMLSGSNPRLSDPTDAKGTVESVRDTVQLVIPVQLRRCSMGMRLVITGANPERMQKPDARLIQVIAKAQDWFGRLTSGQAKGIGELAESEGLSTSRVTRILYHAFLAPDIVRSILNGTQPPSLTLDRLKYQLPLPIDWNEQRKLLGFTQSKPPGAF